MVSRGSTDAHRIPHDGVVEVVCPGISTPNDIEVVLYFQGHFISLVSFLFTNVHGREKYLHRGGGTDVALQ
jgi:uncharacterized membrane protein YwaF